MVERATTEVAWSEMNAAARPKILVVEDDNRIRAELSELLAEAGYDVGQAASVRQAEFALERQFDLVVLDLALPDGDGFEICRYLRQQECEVSIVVLTARDAPAQKVRGLDLGADDYVTKPFHPPELVARIRSVLRRARRGARKGLLRHGELWADPESRRAGRGELAVQLRPREFELLHFLLQHPGRTWTRGQLIDHIWGVDFDGNPRTVDLYVQRLRQHVEHDPGDPRVLETVWGVGYRLSDET